MSNSKGQPDGLFDSGLFGPNSTTSIKFNQSGTYHYFCTIHPWMEGIVLVQGNNTNIPPYAVDGRQKKLDELPVYNFTDNGKVEIGLTCTPLTITTILPINILIDFFEYPKTPEFIYGRIILQSCKIIPKSIERPTSLRSVYLLRLLPSIQMDR
jgi:hypothetical protein